MYKLRYRKEDYCSRFDNVVFESYDRSKVIDVWLWSDDDIFDRYYITVERRGMS